MEETVRPQSEWPNPWTMLRVREEESLAADDQTQWASQTQHIVQVMSDPWGGTKATYDLLVTHDQHDQGETWNFNDGSWSEEPVHRLDAQGAGWHVW